jgi:tetratricopeptide (TPR) repeat protein
MHAPASENGAARREQAEVPVPESSPIPPIAPSPPPEKLQALYRALAPPSAGGVAKAEDHGAALRTAEAELLAAAKTKGTRVRELRLKLAELQLRAGLISAARVHLELVVADQPEDTTALEPLAAAYLGLGQWHLAAEMLARLSYLVRAPGERAELLFRTGEIHRLHLGDPAGASDAYLKAIDLDPHHVSTLRRLIDHYWASREHGAVAEMAQLLVEANALVTPESEPATLARAGVALALAGDVARAALAAHALGEPGAPALADALADAVGGGHLDSRALAAVRTLCGAPGPSREAVRARLRERGAALASEL